MEENKKPQIGLTNAERFPLLTDLSLLAKLKQDDFAPRFNFESGDRLNAHHLAKVHQYKSFLQQTKQFWKAGEEPAWLQDYITWCIETVPFYKGRKKGINLQPTIRRDHLQKEPWLFVSSECSLKDMIVYQTSGTTGEAMDVLGEPGAHACWLPQLESILELYNIRIEKGSAHVAIALICAQQSTLTYASLSTYLEGAGVIKININSADWKDASHLVKYLEKYNPQILTGDPFAFLSLLELQPNITPKALVSSAMKMTDGLRKQLEYYFACPVLDIYSLTECRNIAFAHQGAHRAIRPDLYLEVFDMHEDRPLPYGERGELVITGGNNPFLSLIRYRTGDFCSLENRDGIPWLIGLEARKPVPFYTPNGKLVNNIDVSRAMTNFPLVGFHLHQNKDFSITFTGWSNENIKEQIYEILKQIFGSISTIEISIEAVTVHSGSKLRNFSSDVVKDLFI